MPCPNWLEEGEGFFAMSWPMLLWSIQQWCRKEDCRVNSAVILFLGNCTTYCDITTSLASTSTMKGSPQHGKTRIGCEHTLFFEHLKGCIAVGVPFWCNLITWDSIEGLWYVYKTLKKMSVETIKTKNRLRFFFFVGLENLGMTSVRRSCGFIPLADNSYPKNSTWSLTKIHLDAFRDIPAEQRCRKTLVAFQPFNSSNIQYSERWSCEVLRAKEELHV